MFADYYNEDICNGMGKNLKVNRKMSNTVKQVINKPFVFCQLCYWILDLFLLVVVDFFVVSCVISTRPAIF